MGNYGFCSDDREVRQFSQVPTTQDNKIPWRDIEATQILYCIKFPAHNSTEFTFDLVDNSNEPSHPSSGRLITKKLPN